MFLPIGWPGYAAGSSRRCRAGSTTPTRRFQSSAVAPRVRRAAVGEAYRCMHGIVGVGPTVGFPSTGRAAHDRRRPPAAGAKRAPRSLRQRDFDASRTAPRSSRRRRARDATVLSRTESDVGLRGWGMRFWVRVWCCDAALRVHASGGARASTASDAAPWTVPHLVSAEPPANSAMPLPAMPAAAPPPVGPLAEVTLADIGFVNGLRFANLGGHRELFVPLPQRSDVTVSDLVLVLDDLSAHRGAAQSRGASQ